MILSCISYPFYKMRLIRVCKGYTDTFMFACDSHFAHVLPQGIVLKRHASDPTGQRNQVIRLVYFLSCTSPRDVYCCFGRDECVLATRLRYLHTVCVCLETSTEQLVDRGACDPGAATRDLGNTPPRASPKLGAKCELPTAAP